MNSTESQKKENSPPRGNDNDIKNYDKMSQGSTNKIDYRYIKKCPIKEIISSYKNKESDSNILPLISFSINDPIDIFSRSFLK